MVSAENKKDCSVFFSKEIKLKSFIEIIYVFILIILKTVQMLYPEDY